jgi:hypothetical protein
MAYHPKLRKGFMLPDDPVRLLVGADSKTISRSSQRALSAIFFCDAWLDAKAACDAFDATNCAATVPHREATRLVSASQPGAALNVTLPPDTTVSHSLVPSPEYLTRLQRRLGLYLTALYPILDARAARGVNVSEHEYLGDACLLDANHTSRHDAGLHAVHGALASLKTRLHSDCRKEY